MTSLFLALALVACQQEDSDPSGEAGDQVLQMEDQQDQLMGIDPSADEQRPAAPPAELKTETEPDDDPQGDPYNPR